MHTDDEKVAGITSHRQGKPSRIRTDRTGTQRQLMRLMEGGEQPAIPAPSREYCLSVLMHTDDEKVAGITSHRQGKPSRIRTDRTGTQRQLMRLMDGGEQPAIPAPAGNTVSAC
jgi:hypothetical protein